jgi:hypothetical protein
VRDDAVHGPNAQIAAIYRQCGELTKIDFKPTTRKMQNERDRGHTRLVKVFSLDCFRRNPPLSGPAPLMGFKNLGGHPDRFLVRSAWRKKAPLGAFLHFTVDFR